MTKRGRRAGSVLAAVVAVAMLATGCADRGGTGQTDSAAGVPSAGEPETVATTTEPATPEPPSVVGLGAKPTPSATPARKPSQRPTPRRTPKPPTETQVPPAPKPPDEGCTKPRYEGSQASRAEVGQALTNAAGRVYWPVSAPSIRIPLDLLKATAWQESGWQSNIIACDGGRGLMQVMPDTATWMNQRFEKSYDIDDYQDNAYLGATYLAWTTKYIGDMYFDADYRLDADLCTSELNSCLLNAVIAAYNYGHGAVAVEGEPLTIPNPQYVRNVRALMTECECLAF
ncbi:transglycosylase SLT domain-containing protein [Plantactinospora sp. B5E13]|uniref:transglycosylase SLT domain-containing protein n=1 Tax=Plantactinospora sp. B5E13 TaxID=3153758 RepID=UPI00325D7075